jgi:ankyrin repeat protein
MFVLTALAVLVSIDLSAHAGTETATAKVSMIPVFGNPKHLDPAINKGYQWDPHISPDGLSLYFHTVEYGNGGSSDTTRYMMTRVRQENPWGPPVELGFPFNADWHMGAFCLTEDSLELYFASDRPHGFGSIDIWVMKRDDKGSPWGTPVNLGSKVNTAAAENHPSISADGLELYFSEAIWSGPPVRSGGMGGADIWVTKRKGRNDPWGIPVNLGPVVNTCVSETGPSVTRDGLSLYLTIDRGYGAGDIWVTKRKSKDASWNPPVNLGPMVNTSYGETNPDISSDGSTLLFISNRPGSQGTDIWCTSLTDTTSEEQAAESLHYAAVYGNLGQVRVLISNGADQSAKDKEGCTAVHHAVINGHEEIVQFLLTKGADINAERQNGFTPLMDASRNGYLGIVETLVTKGANVNASQGEDQLTPLHVATEQGYIEMVKLLIQRGANVNAKNKSGDTALHVAYSSTSRRFEVVEHLIDAGTDVNAQNNNGQTVLHLAVLRRDSNMIEFLISKGASLDVKNKWDRTPLDIAVNRRNNRIAKLLRKHGAKE